MFSQDLRIHQDNLFNYNFAYDQGYKYVPINKANYREEIEYSVLGLSEPISSRILFSFFTFHVIICRFNMVLVLIFQVLLSDKSNYFPEVACNWEKKAAENVFIHEVYLVYIKYFSLYSFV